MSVSLMSAVFASETLKPTERLVMLALADHADDEGRCYPSIPRLCQRTGLGERAVQTNIRSLCDAGYLTVEQGGGRGRSNLYVLDLNPASKTPFEENTAQETPFLDTETPHINPETPHMVRETPQQMHPEPSRTIINRQEPSKGSAESRLPDGWIPSPSMIAFAKEKGLTEPEIQEFAYDFQSYWSDRRDKGAKKTERGWEQTWRNRINDRLAVVIRNRRALRSQDTGRMAGTEKAAEYADFAARYVSSKAANG